MSRLALVYPVVCLVILFGGCTSGESRGELVVFNAGSLAGPLRAALDTFAARHRVTISQENAGSLETARKLTELHRIPDAIALADEEVFPRFLMPGQLSWYLVFARNRMVVMYGDRARLAENITAENWFDIVRQEGVEVGRADPNLDPAGYRTLMLFDLAADHYSRINLAAALLRAAPARNMRAKSADLVALLQSGNLDYAYGYESVARAAGLRFVNLPPEIDLGSTEYAERYSEVNVTVPSSASDSVTIPGQPIVYALSIPRESANPQVAQDLVLFLISEEGRALLRAAQLDVLDNMLVIGDSVPSAVHRSLEERARDSSVVRGVPPPTSYSP